MHGMYVKKKISTSSVDSYFWGQKFGDRVAGSLHCCPLEVVADACQD